MNKKLKYAHVIIVTDCGGSDHGRYEIALNRCVFPHQHTLAFFETGSKNTLHSGFTAAAHALSTIDFFGPLKPDEQIGILVNAAPRHGNENGNRLRGKNRKKEGEEIFVIELKNGVWVVGPNAGFNLFFFQKEIKQSFLLIDHLHPNTQFRSMESMIPGLVKVLGINDFKHIELQPKPFTPPVNTETGIFVADWDTHGNIYLYSTLNAEQWVPQMGKTVCIKIGNSIARLRHVEGIFAGQTGEQTLTKGSLKLLGREAIYYIVVVGSEAHPQFKCPPVGTPVYIENE